MSVAKNKVLVIDDEVDIGRLLSITIQRMGVECVCASSVGAAKECLAREEFGLCLTDMQLPDGDGMEIIQHIQQQYPHIPVAMITAYGNMDVAVTALKSGAFDFISKPIKLDQIRDLVSSAIRMPPSSPGDSMAGQNNVLIGASAHMRQLQEQIERLARSQAPVFIHGESGVGKELVARAIHERSPRADKLLVPVNCGAIPADLIESELFGHRKGSFTGATDDRIGMFHSANGGSLFLDEVADLPFAMQVKLLRAIQERMVRPVGSQEEEAVDVRIISAAQTPLADLVAAGTFRQDLYYRLDVIAVFVPPLRDRLEDVPQLIEYFVDKISRRNGQAPPQISAGALATLQRYGYPGNVRELENILERCIAMGEGALIGSEDLRLSPTAATGTLRESPVSDKLDEYIEDVEREKISGMLDRMRWNRTRAARELGISLRALRYRMQKLGLTPRASGGEEDEQKD